MTTRVDFETAKLLKEKRYNLPQKKIYNTLGQLWDAHYATMTNSDVNSGAWCTAPTIAEVVMWLYEKHEIWISVSFANKNQWYFNIDKFGFSGKEKKLYLSNYDYNSPTEAYLEAINYCLTKLMMEIVILKEN